MAAATNPGSNTESELGAGGNPSFEGVPFKASEEFSADSDNGGTNNTNAASKPAWNKKSNGSADTAPVMGADSWPALGESARVSSKSSSSDSLKVLADGSASVIQGTGSAASSHSTATIVSAPITPNHATRQKMKRGGGAGPNGNAGFAQEGPPQLDVPHNNPGKASLNPGESFHRESHPHREGGPGQRGGVVGSQSPSSSDHQHQRSSFRRNNSFPHPRGDGNFHQNYRGNQDWNNPRNFGRRDSHMQSPRNFPRGGYVQQRPQHTTPPPFVPPQQMPLPLRSFANPMGFEVPPPVIYVQGLSPDSLRGVPFVAPLSPHPMFFPGPDPQLPTKILNQIDYYFSNENLVKDIFLRRNMDEQGWIPVTLIAGFKKVSSLTDNVQLILDSVRSSTLVEVQGERLRRRNDWMRWVMPSSQSSPTSSSSSPQALAPQLQNISL